MKKISTAFFFLFLAATIAAATVKAVTVFLSEIPFHEYRVLQAQVRDQGIKLQNSQIADQIRRLDRALAWAPDNASIHFEIGRTFHRLASEPDRRKTSDVCVRARFTEKDCAIPALLEKAISHYESAARSNRLVGGARFWRLAARVSLSDRTDSADRETFSRERILSELADAITWENQDPLVYQYAGDLAFRAGDEPLAARCYRRGLEMSLEGLEEIVERVIAWSEGVAALDSIVPMTAEARMRLSGALAAQWRFREAEEAWRQARRLSGEPALENEPGNLAANGRFADPPGSHFPDWAMEKRDGVTLLFGAEGGGLQVDLVNAPATYFHLTQPIRVEPGESYRLTAKIRPEGLNLRSEALIGFEIVHPFDFSIWSAITRCGILQTPNGPACKGMDADPDGYYALSTVFKPPSPVRVGLLRLIWSNNPYQGRIAVREVRIEKVEARTGEENVQSP